MAKKESDGVFGSIYSLVMNLSSNFFSETPSKEDGPNIIDAAKDGTVIPGTVDGISHPYNRVQGTKEDDLIIGSKDTRNEVYADIGDDTILGGQDDDRLFGGNGNDKIKGGAGHDTIQGGAGDDALIGGEGYDELVGGNGNDILDGGADDDRLYGGSGNDYLKGGEGENYLDGGAGDDILRSSGKGDYLVGGEGTDKFIIDYNPDAKSYDSGPGRTAGIADIEAGETVTINNLTPKQIADIQNDPRGIRDTLIKDYGINISNDDKRPDGTHKPISDDSFSAEKSEDGKSLVITRSEEPQVAGGNQSIHNINPAIVTTTLEVAETRDLLNRVDPNAAEVKTEDLLNRVDPNAAEVETQNLSNSAVASVSPTNLPAQNNGQAGGLEV